MCRIRQAESTKWPQCTEPHRGHCVSASGDDSDDDDAGVDVMAAAEEEVEGGSAVVRSSRVTAVVSA